MKKVLQLTLAIGLALVLLGTARAQVLNGDLDAGLTDWSTNSWGTYYDYTDFDGDTILAWGWWGNQGIWQNTTVTFLANTVYTMTVRTRRGEFSAGQGVTLTIQNVNGPWTNVASITHPFTLSTFGDGTPWETFTLTFDTTTNSSVVGKTVGIGVNQFQTSDSWIHVDNVSLVTGRPQVLNGHFDYGFTGWSRDTWPSPPMSIGWYAYTDTDPINGGTIVSWGWWGNQGIWQNTTATFAANTVYIMRVKARRGGSGDPVQGVALTIQNVLNTGWTNVAVSTNLFTLPVINNNGNGNPWETFTLTFDTSSDPSVVGQTIGVGVNHVQVNPQQADSWIHLDDVLLVDGVILNVEKSGANLTLTWPFGTLLEANGVTGPWTTNIAASPYVLAPTADRKFYRLLVQ